MVLDSRILEPIVRFFPNFCRLCYGSDSKKTLSDATGMLAAKVW